MRVQVSQIDMTLEANRFVSIGIDGNISSGAGRDSGACLDRTVEASYANAAQHARWIRRLPTHMWHVLPGNI
jgi:hypothetical protein